MMADPYLPMSELDRLIAEDPRPDDPLLPRPLIPRKADNRPCARCMIRPRRRRKGAGRVYAYCNSCESLNAREYKARKRAKALG